MEASFLFKERILNVLYGKKTTGENFGLISEQWLRNVKLHVKESSYVKYNNIVNNHIIPNLGMMPPEKITTSVVEEFVEKMLRCGRKKDNTGLSEKTVKDIIGVLKAINGFAGRENVEIPCHFEQIRMRVRDTEIMVLSKAEEQRLKEFLMDNTDLKKLGVLTSLYMGLRLGEVCALRREDILLEKSLLRVRYTMQRIQNLDSESDKKTRIIVTEPKSGSSNRDIPIPGFLLDKFQIIKAFEESSYLLTGCADSFIEPRSMENVLKNYLTICDIKIVNYHVLRHTFATRCIEVGFDAKTLSEILGHSNVNITLNRYVHSSMEQKRKLMSMLKE
ncbi:MAG: site-specific integrase [Hespellia sp.]|nr:site-specific integrase [Hespellia sp.]